MKTYCNCESPCVHKGNKLGKIKVYKDGRTYKRKAQVCNNPNKFNTCSYKATLDNVFMF